MSGRPNIDAITDEDELYKILNTTDDFDERKKIRSRMRDIREAKAAEFERQKKEREENQEGALACRLRRAEEQKSKKLAEYDEQAKGGRKEIGNVERALREKHEKADAEKQRKIESYTELGKTMAQVYNAGTDMLQKAEDDKQRRIKELSEEGVSRTTTTEKHTDGGTTTTATTVTTHKTKDGATTTVKQTKQVTQQSGLGGTSYNITKTQADEITKNLVDTFQSKAVPTSSGVIRVKTEDWSSKDGITRRQEKTQAWGNSASKPAGARGARAAFQQMDKTTAPPAGTRPNFLGGGGAAAGRGGGRPVQRSPSTIKQMLLEWCKAMTREYEPMVTITNFSSSWNNGLAFCALIHHFYPDAFNMEELDPKKRRYNFTLAFDTAEKLADIAPLLDVEDMVRMKNPDWKCVFTYVQMFYRRFHQSAPTTPVSPMSPEPQAVK